jgi:hypothetical protein
MGSQSDATLSTDLYTGKTSTLKKPSMKQISIMIQEEENNCKFIHTAHKNQSIYSTQAAS